MDIKKKYIEERQFNFGNMIAHILDFGLIRILHLNKEFLFNHITYFYNKLLMLIISILIYVIDSRSFDRNYNNSIVDAFI